MEKESTKELLEVIELISVIAKQVYKEVRGDGLQLTDAVKIVLDPQFQSALAEALAGITIIPKEVEDLSALEGISIAKRLLTVAEEVVSLKAVA